MLASCRDYFRYCHENSQPRVRATYATLHYRRVPWTSYHYDVICTSYQSMLGRGPQPETWHQEGPKKNEKNESAKVSKTLFLSIIRLTNTNIFIKGPLLIHIRDSQTISVHNPCLIYLYSPGMTILHPHP